MLQDMCLDVGNHSVQMAGLPSGVKEDVRIYDYGDYDDHDTDGVSSNHHHPKRVSCKPHDFVLPFELMMIIVMIIIIMIIIIMMIKTVIS